MDIQGLIIFLIVDKEIARIIEVTETQVLQILQSRCCILAPMNLSHYWS